MGRWQSAGLTEGQWRNRRRPSTPLRAVPLPMPSAQGGFEYANPPCRVAMGRWQREALTEGPLAQPQNQPNQPIDHSIQVPQNISSRHPNHNKPLPPQPFIARRIMLHPKIMRQPINLNDNPPLRRIKIRHIHAHRMLPPKLNPTRPPPQPLPQHHLRQSHRPPQAARHLHRSFRSLPHPNLPTQSFLWRSHGEVAARRADGGAKTHRRRPSTNACGVGPPPHAYGTGRKAKTPTRPTPDQKTQFLAL